MADFELYIIPLFHIEENYSYIFKCQKTGVTFCIDPADGEEIETFLNQQNLKLDYILNTHHHWDHIGGNKYLKEKFGAKIIAHEKDKSRIPEIDIAVKESENVKLGNFIFEVIFIPGHTTGHIAYYSGEAEIIFVGDTLFSSGCGRLFEGTYDELYESLQKIVSLPKNTKIYAGHEYTVKNIEFSLSVEPNNPELKEKYQWAKSRISENKTTMPTTVESELKTNPFVRTLSAEIRNSLGKNSDSYNIEVFKALRKLKDKY